MISNLGKFTHQRWNGIGPTDRENGHEWSISRGRSERYINQSEPKKLYGTKTKTNKIIQQV